MKLSEQYEQLLTAFPNKTTKTTIKDLAKILYCSERHTKNIITNFKKAGWIHWKSGSGRGNFSTLTLLYEYEEFITKIAEEMASTHSIDEAISFIKSKPLNSIQKDRFIDWLFSNLINIEEELTTNNADHLRFASYRPLPSLDPFDVNRRSENHMMRHLFNQLVTFDERTQSFLPEIAHTWKVCPLDKTWTFYLRKQVLFHNGDELTAEDVCFSFLRHNDSNSAYHWIMEAVEDVRALNRYTVTFTLKHPDPYFLTLASSLGGSLIRPEQANKPIGTGPFLVDVNNEDKLTLQANERYFGLRPLLDKVTMYFFPQVYETSTIENIATEKKLNFYQYPNSVKANLAYEENSIIDRGSKLLSVNMNRSIGQDLYLRKAINITLSRTKMIQELTGNRHVPAYRMFSESEAKWNSSFLKARELLSKSQYDDTPLHLYSYVGAGNEKDGEWIQRELKKLGVTVTLHFLPLKELHTLPLSQISDFLLGEQLSDENLHYTYLSAYFGTHSFMQYHLTNKWKYDLKQALLKLPEEKERLKKLSQMEESLCEQHALIYLYRLQQSAIYPNDLKNIHLNALGWVDYTKLWYRHD
ncbi:ABC transporter substrate-binding protein [Alkalihalobacillus sp. 1P02AB]|uniref:SgrR family transcriptional regulator n=1 Tax=Alkalihalobacillus sp. 1P02AB TaxID=3132260 RepID=UPI0039A42D59